MKTYPFIVISLEKTFKRCGWCSRPGSSHNRHQHHNLDTNKPSLSICHDSSRQLTTAVLFTLFFCICCVSPTLSLHMLRYFCHLLSTETGQLNRTLQKCNVLFCHAFFTTSIYWLSARVCMRTHKHTHIAAMKQGTNNDRFCCNIMHKKHDQNGMQSVQFP